MPFKTLLISLNDVARSDALIATSMALAAENDAHLIGVHVVPAPRLHPSIYPHVTATFINECKEFHKEQGVEIKKAFDEAARKAGVNAEWREIDAVGSNVADPVIEHGQQADLIIIGQKNEHAGDGIEADFCERVIMESGRPVLLIPKVGKFDTIGKHVIVGWNATREAARAVFDAMPFLEDSQSTRLIWVDPQGAGERAGNLPGSEMAATLARHGVRATAEAAATDHIDSGNTLLNRAADLGADLLVMGAYGHSRMREFVFGGATRTLLSHMTIPVLMSH